DHDVGGQRRAVVELDIGTEAKRPDETVARDRPLRRQARLEVAALSDLDEALEHLPEDHEPGARRRGRVERVREPGDADPQLADWLGGGGGGGGAERRGRRGQGEAGKPAPPVGPMVTGRPRRCRSAHTPIIRVGGPGIDGAVEPTREPSAHVEGCKGRVPADAPRGPAATSGEESGTRGKRRGGRLGGRRVRRGTTF